jgi:RHS repeat-associated protein
MALSHKFLLFIIGISIILSFSSFNNNTKYSNKKLTDEWALKDVSGMFNERGYYNSNSVSFDENEIISDFNGNLCYSFPMFNMKGPGDIYLDLSLNYNGSVNYEVIAGDTNIANFNIMPRYNMSVPGWIFSLNGMAVQMLNFETDFFTKPQTGSDTVIQNNNVHLLATGYHITDKLQTAGTDNDDILMIMRGDGTVLNLRRITYDNCTGSSNSENCYIGEYYSDNKGENTRAKVEYLETGGYPTYRNRRVSVMKGDGLTYIYEEYKNCYMDFPYNTGSLNFRPQVLMLKKVKDRFGNFLELNYITTIDIPPSGQKTIYGRPLLSNITACWKMGNVTFTYYPLVTGMVKVNYYQGNYKIELDEMKFENDGNHRSNVTEIENPAGNTIEIDYKQYSRVACKVKNPKNESHPMNLYLAPERIKELVNYNGGIRKYLYAGANDAYINMEPENYKVMSEGVNSNYFGQGRDIFFTNMLVSKRTYEGQKLIKRDTISYTYITTRTENEWKAYPVDDSDDYYTNRIVYANPSYLNNSTPETIYYERQYKNYRLVQVEHNPENPDWPGHVKLLYEKQWTSPNYLDKSITYQFDARGIITYNGSFLDTAVIDSIKGIKNTNRFVYGFAEGPFTGADTVKNPVDMKREINPFGRITQTDFKIYYDTSIHYRNAKFNANHPHEPNEQEFDTTYFYLINLPAEINIFYSQNNPLYKESYYYNEDNDDTSYMAQLLNKKISDANNLNNYKEIRYKYFIRDTIGVQLYPTANTKPSNEGKLKEVIDARGNSVKYFYHPIFDESGLDEILAPMMKYYRILTNGTSVESKTRWEDTRFPTNTVFNPYSDYTFNTYQQFNPSGNRTMFFDNYRSLSEFTYQSLERINTVTLPYDFDTANSKDTIIVDTSYLNIDYILPTNATGMIDYVTPDYFKNQGPCYGGLFISKVFRNGIYQNYRCALIGFNDTTINHLQRLDFAHLIFYPTLYTHSYGGDSSASKTLIKFYPLTYFGSSSINEVSYYYSTHNIYSTTYEVCSNGFANYYNLVDLTDLLNYHILQRNAVFAGLKLDAIYDDPSVPEPPPGHEFHLDIGNCIDQGCGVCGCGTWSANYSPRLHIGGVYIYLDTTKYTIYRNSTIKYEFDDENHKTTIISKLDNDNNKKTAFLFDEFYRIKQSRLYTSEFDFDSTIVKYNYLGLKSITKDGKGDSTLLSYDELLNQNKTENPDNSETLDSTFYLNGYNYTFGSIPGLVIRKVFTDEIGNKFEKYYDAVGNLRREVKFAENNQHSENLDTLRTDYLYDSLYRIIQVKTPNNKYIYYSYDGYGRQSQRTTPDAGTVMFKYDKNDNLRFSQDENQIHKPSEYRPPKYIAFRGYDKLNRVIYTGDTYTEEDVPEWDYLNPDITNDFEDYNSYPNNFLTINVYDTLANAYANIFNTYLPSNYGYNDAPNLTVGNLTATATRTIGTEGFLIKYYRYDARGRVIKQWNVLDWFYSWIEYEYNSANQITKEIINDQNSNYKEFRYEYDNAGRMNAVKYVDGPHVRTFASYEYNENSQISTHYLANGSLENTYSYNNRNWVTAYNGNKINYSLNYLQNGNISNQSIGGEYQNSLSDSRYMSMNYTYDKSNRLLTAENIQGHNNYEYYGANTYDFDGNLLTLTRSSNGDNFNYNYYSGTNRLKKIQGEQDQYTYDYNGNLLSDLQRYNYDMKYDYRNLITEVYNSASANFTFKFIYRYDEAGNRIQKITYRSDNELPPPIEWVMMSSEYYVRDISGKEIAVYNRNQNGDFILNFWNVWGLSNEGKITYENNKYYYLKDHLGSIRAIYDQNINLVSAQDYDCWGYELINRTYNNENKYKFTSKERDLESGYDYFGARYYDARIGRWGQMEPLYDKFTSFSPYSYGILNPIKLYDFNGLIPRITINGNNIKFEFTFYYSTSEVDPINGLNKDQITSTENIIKNMETWTGTKISIDGKEYNIDVFTDLKPLEGKFNDAASEKITSEKFVNFVKNATEDTEELEKNQGVGMRGEVLEVLSGNKLRPFITTGAHELGHYFKLTHNDFKIESKKIDGQKIDIESIMGRVVIFQNVEYRNNPSSFEWNLVYQRNQNYFK